MKKFITLIIAICFTAAVAPTVACAEETRLSHYDLYVSYDAEAQTLTGTVDFDFCNDTDNELSDLKFNLYGNAFRENATYKPVSKTYENRAYYAGKSYGGMEITNVENCAGWSVAGEDENVLIVNLTQPVYPEERVQVKISYVLTLAKVNHRTGVTPDAVNLGNFYPVLCAYTAEGFTECPYYYCGDPFVSECADYTVTIDLPEEYIAASSGSPVSESKSDGRKKCEYKLQNARDFAFVLSDKFEVITENADGVAVSYYYVKDSNAQVNLSVAAESLKYFSKTFGAYAYPTLSVVQTGFCYGGMEYPALTMISDALDSDNSVYTITHENAHQWWYAMVGNDQLNDGWMDEGLAEYSTLSFFENNPTYGFTRRGIVDSATKYYRAFFTVFEQLNGTTDTRMHRNLSEYSSELEYNNVVYNKGLILFDMLRSAVGEEKFFGGLKTYFAENNGKIATPEALYSCFVKTSDVEGLFDSFIEGKIII